jgi:hypothetical protein
MPTPSRFFARPAIALAAALCIGSAQAELTTVLTGPAWEIAFSNYGYSDYLGDLTPSFQGREYLSGEWGAAVGYSINGNARTPTWLEPDFIFPDWQTNSNFGVVSPMALGPLTSQGLPTASSVIGNGDLRITQTIKIVDTLTGIAMGNAAASDRGAGASLLSNRYVLMQSYSFENISGQTLTGLQVFQFLHGLNAQSAVLDNRAYGGALGEYRYDLTLGGDAGGGAGQFDYIGFHSRIAPTAVEAGAYGTFAVDNHGIGKPSVGTHLSIEANALTGVDHYASSETWVAGAQRFDLGSLSAGQSANFDVALSILTGYQVGGGDDGSGGSAGGGSSQPGGVDFHFEGSVDPGKFFFSFEVEDSTSIAGLIGAGEIGPLTFGLPGSELPLWEIEYDASFSGQVRLTFGLTGVLPDGLDPSRLHIYHWHHGTWEDLGGSFDAAANTITITTDSLSPFALGVTAAVPEPASAALLLGGLVVLIGRRRLGAGVPPGARAAGSRPS